jgi:signal transduction histidine kinase
MDGLRQSFALRVAALSAALVVLVCGAGFGWGYLRVEGALGAQLDAAIATDAESYLEDLQSLGPQGFAASVALAARRRGALVLLRTADGSRIAGTLDGAPVGLRGFATLRAPDGRDLRVLGAALPGGLELVVGADLAPVRRGAAALTGALPIAGAVAALAALLLGFVVARRLERRLRAVSEAGQAVMAGDLSRRLPLSGSQDEFDRLAATMNAVLARVETLVEGLQSTTASIAHDLRSPLFRLRQQLEAAVARPREPEADANTLEASLVELDGVLGTFSALLRIARAEAGLTDAGFAAVDLSALAGEVAELYAAVAEDAAQRLDIAVRPGQLVRGDAALLRQAIANLIENALTHGGPGVSVEVRVRAEPGPILSVRDNGPGIPASERGRVLERFYRLDRSRNTPGSGLGLALVAAVARLHGATLRLEDAKPGLEVSLAFPAL